MLLALHHSERHLGWLATYLRHVGALVAAEIMFRPGSLACTVVFTELGGGGGVGRS